MRESDREYLASSSGLEPYADGGNVVGVASGRGDAGQPLSSDINVFVCRSYSDTEKAKFTVPEKGKGQWDTAESKNLSMRQNSKRENREILLVCTERSSNYSAAWSDQRTSQTVIRI
jgi:hypothetical protein